VEEGNTHQDQLAALHKVGHPVFDLKRVGDHIFVHGHRTLWYAGGAA
jgi:hypothetical protein